MKRKHLNLKEHFQKEEERAGVAGFRDINDKLEQTGKQTALLNDKKEKTLDEISDMVNKIAQTMEGKKQELEPLIGELKQKRKQFQVLQEKHNGEKECYDEAAAKLMSDRSRKRMFTSPRRMG